MVVDQVPPEPPLPPLPQAPAATEIRPLLSVCKHLVPKVPKLPTVRVLLTETALATSMPKLAVFDLKSVVDARPET